MRVKKDTAQELAEAKLLHEEKNAVISTVMNEVGYYTCLDSSAWEYSAEKFDGHWIVTCDYIRRGSILNQHVVEVRRNGNRLLTEWAIGVWN